MTDNAFAKLSVLLEFKSDLFSEIAESSLSFISKIFSFPVNFIWKFHILSVIMIAEYIHEETRHLITTLKPLQNGGEILWKLFV